MKTIRKYSFGIGKTLELSLPMNSTFLSASVENGRLTLYFLVSDSSETVKHKYIIVPTGTEIADNMEYLGTFMVRGGVLVQHLFKMA